MHPTDGAVEFTAHRYRRCRHPPLLREGLSLVDTYDRHPMMWSYNSIFWWVWSEIVVHCVCVTDFFSIFVACTKYEHQMNCKDAIQKSNQICNQESHSPLRLYRINIFQEMESCHRLVPMSFFYCLNTWTLTNL